jgi:RNA polymerase subunit RPABC4/transcription elongation factor Spt4
MSIKYCKVCNKNVTPIKRFGLTSIIWIILFGVFYLPYYLFLKRKECPMCHSKKFEKVHKELMG